MVWLKHWFLVIRRCGAGDGAGSSGHGAAEWGALYPPTGHHAACAVTPKTFEGLSERSDVVRAIARVEDCKSNAVKVTGPSLNLLLQNRLNFNIFHCIYLLASVVSPAQAKYFNQKKQQYITKNKACKVPKCVPGGVYLLFPSGT